VTYRQEVADAAMFSWKKSIMFSTDYPFTDMKQATAWLDQAPVDEDAREHLAWLNATRLLPV